MPSRSGRYSSAFALVAAVLLVLTGCSSTQYLGDGDWAPKPEVELPQGNSPDPTPPPPPPTDPNQPDQSIRATGLNQPWGIAALPDGTALVGERTTGQVTKVSAQPGVPQQPLYVVPGVDGTGEGGLLGMAPSVAYLENGLIFAYVTTATDNRVVIIDDAGAVTPVLTGIPKGATHNGGAIAVAADGTILVATGDTGNPALIANPNTLAGKILHIDQFGSPASTDQSSPIAASGFADPTGLCLDGERVYAIDAGGGPAGGMLGNAAYLVSGGESFDSQEPLISYVDATAGAAGCAVVGANFVATGLNSLSIMTSTLDIDGNPVDEPVLTLTGQYGRLRALSVDLANGLMWVATYNRDGFGQPIAEDDRVLLIPPPGGGGADSVA